MANRNFSLTQDLLHELFDYRDGELFWKVNSGNRKNLAGSKAGTINNSGYASVCVNQKEHLVHRLIYAMFHGSFDGIIDHIDGNKLNNRVENLRIASYSQNSFNSKLYKSNKTGVKGVSYVAKFGKFVARCQTAGKSKYLGAFDSLEQADFVLRAYRLESHKEFANHG